MKEKYPFRALLGASLANSAYGTPKKDCNLSAASHAVRSSTRAHVRALGNVLDVKRRKK